MLNRNSLRYLLPLWAVVAVGRILVANSESPASYALLGLMWLLSAVLLVLAVALLVVADGRERQIEAICLGLMTSALLVQGVIGGDDTIGITTPLFFGSLAVFIFVYAKRGRQRSPV